MMLTLYRLSLCIGVYGGQSEFAPWNVILGLSFLGFCTKSTVRELNSLSLQHATALVSMHPAALVQVLESFLWSLLAE